MTSLCYLHPVPLVTARGKTACPQCGTLYPTLPGPAAAGQLAGENRARSAGYLHREPTPKGAAGSIPASPVSFPFLPAVEPSVSAPAQLPRRATSSPSAGGLYSTGDKANERTELQRDLRSLRHSCGGLDRLSDLGNRQGRHLADLYVNTPSARKQAARADAAPGRFTPQQAGRGTYTGDVR